MTIEEMRQKKRKLGLTNEMLSERAGVPLGTVRKVMAGITKAPRKSTLDALERALFPKGQRYRIIDRAGQVDVKPLLMVREQPAEEAWKEKPGEYTIEDYYALPDDVRMELIDGRFYDMGAPLNPHQAVIGELYAILRECILSHGLPCLAMVSPVDVQLDRDNKTMVQPDVLVVCEKEKLQTKVVFGAPDFVIEVLSPSTANKDRVIKLQKYWGAGVREYWIVDLKRRDVTCYDLDEEGMPVRLYTFRDRVPVRISEGLCEVDFRGIGDLLDRWFS